MSSKADYLKRYGDASADKKRRKKKPKPTTPGAGQLRIVDEDVFDTAKSRAAVDAAWEKNQSEDEAPVVVDALPSSLAAPTRGTWGSVATQGDSSPPRRTASGNGVARAAAEQDASPPRRRPHVSPDNSPPRRGRQGSSDASPPRRRRHDSPPGGADASPPRRRRHDSPAGDSSPPRRRRHDSPPASADASPPRRKRHDSPRDADASPPRRQRHDSPNGGVDASSPRRRRHDSPDDASPPRRSRHASPGGADTSPPRRSRRTSPPVDADASPPRRRRHDSPPAADDASPPRRRRHDSPQGTRHSAGADASPPRRRRSPASSPPRRGRAGHDSVPGSNGGASPPRRRARHDSPEDEQRRRSGGSGGGGGGGGGGEGGGREKTAAGYTAGLQSGQQFKEVERELRERQAKELATMAGTSGQNAETVYRDRKGRKLDMLNEFMRQQEAKEGAVRERTEAEYEWGRGKVQKEDKERQQVEMENIKLAPFARTAEHLDEELKSVIRPEDPMAAYMTKKQAQKASTAVAGIPAKPVYKGPPPKPNRFGIRPGYRWDGVDRGNGWEQKLVEAEAARRHQGDACYQWSISDM